MNTAHSAYKQRVWAFLQKMKPGERFRIADICESDNSAVFIECIKDWMEKFPWQGGVSFNIDYTEFYMTHIPDKIPETFLDDN